MPLTRQKDLKAKGRDRRLLAITPDEAVFVEETGVAYESLGLPRMAGRIVGWLLLCDPPHQSLAQLGGVLHASKGSISTVTRALMQMGIVKRLSLPGDRRDYVSIPLERLTTVMEEQTQRTRQFRQLAERGLAVLAGTPRERQARLREMRDLYVFLDREMPALLSRWKRERASGRN